jgi:uncharacterized protein DUF397
MGRRGTAHLVEIDPAGLRWAKSSASSGSGTNCVEIASCGDVTFLRCSRNHSPRVSVPRRAFTRLLRHVSER